MFEIDKNSFGEFVAERRKAKGYTQKDLADKLFVSDKAVSKWERGISMPDISLLVPLADILEVSVTELLEGRKLDRTSEMNTEHVETLVKKALTLSEDTPEKQKERQKRNAVIFFSCALFTALEICVGTWSSSKIGVDAFFENFLILEALSFGFGIYLWLFIKERLPVYYDENNINTYSDGVFRMHVPGVHFNNSNWPHVVKYLRNWSLITMLTVPMIYLLLLIVIPNIENCHGIQMRVLILYLAGLFVPIYIVGKKYE